jgi:hypothetical protein
MMRGKTRPFTAPRASKPVQTGHRKDNAEWGKRMERQLAQIEKNQASVETTRDVDDVPTALILAHTSEKTAQTSQTTTQNVDKHLEAVGQKIAKDFGKQGVFFGSVIGVEYDSDDNGKENPFYVAQYTDGDKEDLNDEEYGFAHELCLQMGLDATDELDVDSATDEEESYRPSPQVKLPLCTYFIMISPVLMFPIIVSCRKRRKRASSKKKTDKDEASADGSDTEGATKVKKKVPLY